jgi:lipoprotein releasing system LolC/E family transmembrane protein
MYFPLYIAKRYLFSRKKNHIINWVSFISVCGVAIGTMALVCVLSVFNGFQGVIEDMFSAFDAPLRITSVQGKTFEPDSIRQVLQHPDVDVYCEIIEENALLRYADKQLPVVVKGVPAHYSSLNHLDSILLDGSFEVDQRYLHTAVAGIGLARTLGASVHFVEPIWLYVPKRQAKVNLMKPDNAFNRDFVYLQGIFMVQQEKYDYQLILVPLSMARQLYQYDTEVSAIELKLKDNVAVDKVQDEMQTLLGESYVVKNRYQQQAEFYNMLQIEKWVTYLILSFILLIAVFNIIGSLSMLIIDKSNDVQLLQHLGATHQTIQRIFLLEGWLIAIIGAFAGVLLGLLLCWLQATFGLISLGSGEGFVISSYPVQVVWSDVLIIAATVMVMGFLAAIYPSKYFYSKQ